jgi:creatinine amidohydrolase
VTTDWREGHAVLSARVRELPAAVARTAARALAPLGLGDRPVRRVVATGVGSSTAHAALLVHELRRAGRDAIVVPFSAFLAPPTAAPDDVLVVFSQGCSPNARLALDTPERWRRIVLVTAVTDAQQLAPLRSAGVVVQTIDGANEFGTLVRVVGPMAGYVMALRLAQSLGGLVAPDFDGLTEPFATVVPPALGADQLAAPLAFVTSGTYADVVQNLQYKIMEGLLLPMPPVWDVLHLAHGPFQERLPGAATFMALTRPDAPGEAALLDRFASMLDPATMVRVRCIIRERE